MQAQKADDIVRLCVYRSEIMKVFGGYPVGKLVYHRGHWLKVKLHHYPTEFRGYGFIELETTEKGLVPATVWWRVNQDGTVEKRIPESWRKEK